MLMLSIVPISILLVHSVTSVDSYNHVVPRRHTQFIRTQNHPPSVENYQYIPVTVVYDDPGEAKVRNKNVKKGDVVIKDEKLSLKNGTAEGKPTNLEIRSVNHPPSYDLIPATMVKDYEDEMLFKPRARSINVKAPVTVSTESDKLKPVAIVPAESEMKSSIKTRRRSQQVRKVKVNKSQLDVYVNETKMSEVKVAEKEATTEAVRTVSKEALTLEMAKNHDSFKRRKGMRDPVVPIIESESYVFAHSGDFHYSYEGGDGTKAFEKGALKSSSGGAGSAVEGSFSYKDKDGKDYSLTYTADENGYRPVGAHLPTPPPIPPAIQRALEHLATKTTPEPITERVKTLVST